MRGWEGATKWLAIARGLRERNRSLCDLGRVPRLSSCTEGSLFQKPVRKRSWLASLRLGRGCCGLGESCLPTH